MSTESTDLICQAHSRRAFADVALVATTLGLVLSLAVAITTVSIGIARAETAAAHDIKSPKRCD